MSRDIPLLSLTALRDAIAAGEISARAATEAALARIARWQPHLNAFIEIDADGALAEADAADAARAEGRSLGPLHGVPLAHKDMFYEAGHPCTCGSAVREGFVPATTSTALKRLRAAGSVRLGTLHMSEFAYGPTGHNAPFGSACNPWNTAHAPGGSSSGSGAAVAARLTTAALGSDTGGSVRLPAHFCGVTGLKTTVGLVSRAHAMPLSQSLDTVGVLAQTAADTALILALMAGGDPDDPTCRTDPLPDYLAATALEADGLVIGVPDAFYVEGLDPAVAAALDAAIATFERLGATVRQVRLPDQAELSSASQIVLAAEAVAFHRGWLLTRAEAYGPQVRARLENGLSVPAVTYLEALRWRGPALAAHLAAITGTDALLMPAGPAPAPTLAESDVGGSMDAEAVIQRLTRFTRPINYLGLPALTVPAGFSPAGLPVGLQIVGRPFAEAMLLRLGAAFQRATPFHLSVPELPS